MNTQLSKSGLYLTAQHAINTLYFLQTIF